MFVWNSYAQHTAAEYVGHHNLNCNVHFVLDNMNSPDEIEFGHASSLPTID